MRSDNVIIAVEYSTLVDCSVGGNASVTSRAFAGRRKQNSSREAESMGSLGFPELVLIFLVALVVFGPRRLPEIGKSLGRALGEFKRATNDLRNTLETEVRAEEEKKLPPLEPTPPPLQPEAPASPNVSRE
jgi:TatA/E family protein of Tat protein translocase